MIDTKFETNSKSFENQIEST